MLRDEVVVRGCVLMVLRCVVADDRVAVRAVVALLRRALVAVVLRLAVVLVARLPEVRSTVRPPLLPPTMV